MSSISNAHLNTCQISTLNIYEHKSTRLLTKELTASQKTLTSGYLELSPVSFTPISCHIPVGTTT